MKEDPVKSTIKAVSYFILLDNTSNTVLDARICAVPPEGILDKDFEKPVIHFNYLDEEFEKFIDRNIYIFKNISDVPNWNFLRFDMSESSYKGFTCNVKEYIQNEFFPDVCNRNIKPEVNLSAKDVLQKHTLDTTEDIGGTDEISINDILYVALESKQAWISTPNYPVMKESLEENELICCYDDHNKNALPPDIYKQLYLLSIDCPGNYPVMCMAIALDNYKPCNKTSLNNFFIDFMYQLGYSQGPYIAFLNKKDSYAYIHVSNVLKFNDAYFQIRDELIGYKLEKIFHSLEKKHLFHSKSQKITGISDSMIEQNLKNYLITGEKMETKKKDKSKGL